MKITFLMTYAGMSGGTRVIVTQAQELMARGHEVRVFSTPPPTPGFRKTVSSLLHGNGWPKITKAGESFSTAAVFRIPSFRNSDRSPITICPMPTW